MNASRGAILQAVFLPARWLFCVNRESPNTVSETVIRAFFMLNMLYPMTVSSFGKEVSTSTPSPVTMTSSSIRTPPTPCR